MHTVKTGENAFSYTHGSDVWEYRREHPDEGGIFDAAMVAQTRAIDRALLDAYDFGRFGVVVDIGGGRGGLLVSILRRHPAVHGVLFDQPHVVSGAREFVQAEGVDERCEVFGGDFFEAVPRSGDAYVLKWIIHDWLDPEAITILQVCRRALSEAARIVIIERIVGAPNDDLDTKQSDLQMLVSAGGRERTPEEFDELFGAAGLRRTGVTPTTSGISLIEAVGSSTIK